VEDPPKAEVEGPRADIGAGTIERVERGTGTGSPEGTSGENIVRAEAIEARIPGSRDGRTDRAVGIGGIIVPIPMDPMGRTVMTDMRGKRAERPSVPALLGLRSRDVRPRRPSMKRPDGSMSIGET